MPVILKWMTDNNIKVATFQETKLTKKSKLSDTLEFTLIKKDRDKEIGGGRGLAFLVHEEVMFQNVPTPRDDPQF